MNTTDTTTNPYGLTLKGVPKQKPGRKAKDGPSATIKTIYLLDGKVLGVGKPGLNILRNRTFVTLPKNVAYDPAIHGLGVRPPTDDARADQMEANKAAKLAAKEAAKAEAKAKALAAKNAPATPAPAGPSIGEGSVTQNVDVAPVTAPSEVITESETTTL